MKNNNKAFTLLIGVVCIVIVICIINNYKIVKKDKHEVHSGISNDIIVDENTDYKQNSTVENSGDISAKTDETYVANYVKQNHRLPDYYITKSEARKQGWNPSKGNLCDVLPGSAIGGDKFSNREGRLPDNAKYFEADVNYSCGHRDTDRLIFTKNGDVWVTHDHYRTFDKK